MQNEELDSSLEPLVAQLRRLPESDPRAVKRVLARVRQADGLPNARRRALRRYFTQRGRWWSAAAVLTLAAGGALFMRTRDAASAGQTDLAVSPPHPPIGAIVDEGTSDRIVSRQFAIENQQARQVALVGDFNQWNPARHRLHRDGDSARWVITVQLPTGLHKYAFIVNDSVWTPDPTAVRTVDRDFGVTSSLVLVQ
jgi:hypothetical protein